jgi:hypothetical protein
MEIMAPIKKGGDLHKNSGKIARKGESMTGGHKKDFCPFAATGAALIRGFFYCV